MLLGNAKPLSKLMSTNVMLSHAKANNKEPDIQSKVDQHIVMMIPKMFVASTSASKRYRRSNRGSCGVEFLKLDLEPGGRV